MTEHPVVIAGGGPTGLMLAGELALARSTSPLSSGALARTSWLARRRSAFTHHRGSRSAWNR
jgi:alkanesulfonate monooxygenase SsuD/methylene tetrahydromethanopterin reductase-like flavin-dependent oxidoreductase (luciferase family)